jgi:hypothetical protein
MEFHINQGAHLRDSSDNVSVPLRNTIFVRPGEFSWTSDTIVEWHELVTFYYHALCSRRGKIGLMLVWSPTVAVCIHWNPTQGDGNIIEEGLRTYGMGSQNCMRKDFLCKRHSLLSQFVIYFTRSASLYCEECVCVCVCVCIHICDCVRIVYELPLLPNSNTNGTFLYKPGALRSVY